MPQQRILRSVKRLLLALLVMTSIGVSAPAAHADSVRDWSCLGNNGPICGASYYISKTGPGRCDITAKFLGGGASAVMFQAIEYQGGGIPSGWSAWLRPGESVTFTYWDPAIYVDVNTWKAQLERTADVRVRTTGACSF